MPTTVRTEVCVVATVDPMVMDNPIVMTETLVSGVPLFNLYGLTVLDAPARGTDLLAEIPGNLLRDDPMRKRLGAGACQRYLVMQCRTHVQRVFKLYKRLSAAA